MKIGIDLGTTFSLVAGLKTDGTAELLPDNMFRDLYSTPSAIHINANNAVVGYMVDTMLEENPTLPVMRFFKRSFGTGKPIYFDSQNRPWLAESLGALVLKKLKFDVESYVGRKIEGSVITIPAHFNDAQRKAVKDAAAMAELPLLGLVEEPVAAALHYGVLSSERDKVILVYDLGGGTFDASILTMDDSGVYVLAKDGIIDIGGKEFDETIGALILEQYEKIHGQHLQLDAISSLQLRHISEEIKIELAQPNKSFIKKMVLLGTNAFEVIINKKDFELGIREMIEKTIECIMMCLDGAGLSEDHIDSLMLVGGSSMIPYVKQRLSQIFSKAKDQTFYHEPMRAVAYGAAVHAAQLSGDADAYQIPAAFRGVSGYNIGIETKNPHTGQKEVDLLIKKNLPLPISSKRTYYTSSDSQQYIKLNIVQFRDGHSEKQQIGQLVIGPLQNPQINYPIEVTIENAMDSTISIQAFDPNTGIELSQTFGNKENDGSISLISQKMLVDELFINNL